MEWIENSSSVLVSVNQRKTAGSTNALDRAFAAEPGMCDAEEG